MNIRKTILFLLGFSILINTNCSNKSLNESILENNQIPFKDLSQEDQDSFLQMSQIKENKILKQCLLNGIVKYISNTSTSTFVQDYTNTLTVLNMQSKNPINNPKTYSTKPFNSGFITVLLTSQEDANLLFNEIKKLISAKNYNLASQEFIQLTLSITNNTLPYSEKKFNEYKKVFIKLINKLTSQNLEDNTIYSLIFSSMEIFDFTNKTLKKEKEAYAFSEQFLNALRKTMIKILKNV